MACDIGTSGAPAAPCTVRQATRVSIEPARPQAAEAAVKAATQARHRLRAPKRAASQPVSGVITAVATRLKVTTQATWSWVAESAPWICGSVTFTAVRLIAYRKVTVVHVASTHPRSGTEVIALLIVI